MAFDSCMMRAVLHELSEQFPEGKIEKIYQPSNDEIDLIIHYAKASRRLIFNVGAGGSRIQLTDTVKENPVTAPMFCMFLRKRLIGGRIVEVEQPGFDRIAKLRVQGYDEMGYRTEMYIVCEIMGKYANFILLDSDEKIISALKLIDFAASSIRQVLPGLKYTLPPLMNKLSPLDATRVDFDLSYDRFFSTKTTERFITENYLGVATQIARELAYRATGGLDTPLMETDKEKLYLVISDWQEQLRTHRYKPTVALDRCGMPKDYSYMNISYLENSHTYEHFDSLSEMLDLYFRERDRIEKINQRAEDVRSLLAVTISRIERKLEAQRQTLADSGRGEEYKRIGDLITANLYRIKPGVQSIIVTDFYDEAMPDVEIKLDPRLSPNANAQKNYKLYTKCKTARIVLTEQIKIWERELEYLKSVKVFLDNAETEADIMAIRDELYMSGYGKQMRNYRPGKKPLQNKPLSFSTSGGFTVFVGRNNVENERLTFKCADKEDLWFHVKGMPGSHVILITDGREPGDDDYTEACQLAAGYSSASGDNVAVDYTRVKNIKKPSGAKCGFVIYKTNYTAYVTPRKNLG